MKHEYLEKQQLKAALHILNDQQSMLYLRLCREEGKTTAFIRLQIATGLFDDEQAQTDEFERWCVEHKDDFVNIPRQCKGKICHGCQVGRRVCCSYHKTADLADYMRIYQLSPHKRGRAKQLFPMLTELTAEAVNCYTVKGMLQIDIAGYLTCLGHWGLVTKNSVAKSIQRAKEKGLNTTKITKPPMIRFGDKYMTDEKERSKSRWDIKRTF